MDIDRALEILCRHAFMQKESAFSSSTRTETRRARFASQELPSKSDSFDRRTKLRPRARNQGIFPPETTHLEQRFQAHLFKSNKSRLRLASIGQFGAPWGTISKPDKMPNGRSSFPEAE